MGIFGLKINYLATLNPTDDARDQAVSNPKLSSHQNLFKFQEMLHNEFFDKLMLEFNPICPENGKPRETRFVFRNFRILKFY
jgi:hypothetical protein